MTTSIFDRPRSAIASRARLLGFDVCGFAGVEASWSASGRLEQFIAAGRHGQMDWMQTTKARRSHPRKLWPQARSAVVLGLNYGPDDDPREVLDLPAQGAISVYAQGRDYHQLIKGRLKTLASFMVSRLGGEAKVFVDTAPLMEKPLAAMAGVGWQGKHTNLVSADFGSWLFLGSVLTTLALEADAPAQDRCGSCQACLDVCPTKAFPAPYQLDARRCISYLTIEHAGPVPVEFRAAMGNRIYGCDDCLAVCPWNKFAKLASETKLHARQAGRAPALAELAALDDAGFRTLFSASPIKRIGRDRFVRNVLYAIGNSREASLAAAAAPRLADPCETVRDAARWALERLHSPIGKRRGPPPHAVGE